MSKNIVDTNTVEFPNDLLLSFNSDKFNESKSRFAGRKSKVVSSYHCNPEVIGLSNIYIGENSTKIITSAKLLKSKYLEGINENTFDKWVSEINKTGLIRINKYDLWESGIYHKIDVDNYIYLDSKEKVSSYINELQLYASNNKYNIRTWNNSGIVISGKAKSNSFRLILYSKGRELDRHKKENKIVKSYLSGFDIDRAGKQLRVETNLRTYRSIRTAYNMPKDNNRFYIKDILTSNANPNLRIFNNMFNIDVMPKEKRTESELINYMIKQGYKWNQIEKEIAKRYIARLYNCDLSLIMNHVKNASSNKSNPSSIRKEYQRIINELNAEEMTMDINVIEDIKNRLVA